MSVTISGTNGIDKVAAGSVESGDIAANAVSQTNLASGVVGNGPAFSAYVGTGQAISASTATVVAYNSKNFDTATCFNNTNGTVTLNGISVPPYAFCPNVAGYYQINTAVTYYYPSSTTFSQVQIFKNTTPITTNMTASGSAAQETSAQSSSVVYLNGSGDYVLIKGYTSASGVTIDNNSYSTFSAAMVRAA